MIDVGTKTEQVISKELYKILEVRLTERSEFASWLPGLHNTTFNMVANTSGKYLATYFEV